MKVIHLTEFLPNYVMKNCKVDCVPDTYEEVLNMSKQFAKVRWNQKIKEQQKVKEELDRKKNKKEKMEALMKKPKNTDKDPA